MNAFLGWWRCCDRPIAPEKTISGAQWTRFSQMKIVQNLHLDDLLGSSKLSGEVLVLEHLLVGSLEQAVAANCQLIS